MEVLEVLVDFETANAIDNIILTGTQAGLSVYAAATDKTPPVVATAAGLQAGPVQSAFSGQFLLAVVVIAGLYFITK